MILVTECIVVEYGQAYMPNPTKAISRRGEGGMREWLTLLALYAAHVVKIKTNYIVQVANFTKNLQNV
jgi:hypothetical protein